MSDTDTNLLRNTIASVQKPGWLMEHAAPGSVAKLLADLSAPLLDEVERLRSELSSWREAAAEWERAAGEWEQAAKEAWSQAEHFSTVAGAMVGMAKDGSTTADPPITAESPQRRLSRRFLELPWLHQVAIAEAIGVRTNDDRSLTDEAFALAVFNRAAAKGLLAQLWNETESRHPDPAAFNPWAPSTGEAGSR